MILIGDSGSTSTNWALIKDRVVVKELSTEGFNPYYYSPDILQHALRNELDKVIEMDQISEVYYFAAGCSTEGNCSIVRNALSKLFTRAHIVIDHDLYGAALALFGEEDGIACILGTGSNSCLWEGGGIVQQAASLGYLIGDEGSGTYLGKLLVAGILRGEAGQDLASIFYEEYSLDMSKILAKLYREDRPNKFLAGLAPFVKRHIDHPFCQKIVRASFEAFVGYSIKIYPDFRERNISFTGSIAYYFKDQLLEVLLKHGIRDISIMQKPIQGLSAYYIAHHMTGD